MLVKLRQQCVEVVEGALKACAETMAEEAAMGRLRPALMDTQQQPGPAHPNAAATQAGKASKSLGHPYLDEIAEMVCAAQDSLGKPSTMVLLPHTHLCPFLHLDMDN